MAAKNLLLTFRLYQERRSRLKARLGGGGGPLSAGVTHGLRPYVASLSDAAPAAGRVAGPVAGEPPRLPERVAARLRELRSSGRTEMLSATLGALTEAGWRRP